MRSFNSHVEAKGPLLAASGQSSTSAIDPLRSLALPESRPSTNVGKLGTEGTMPIDRLSWKKPATPSLNHHVCALPKRLRDGDSECLRGLEINPQVEFSWLLDREIGRFCTAEDSVDEC